MRDHAKTRRAFLRLAAGAAILPVLPRVVEAQTYPNQPVRIVVGLAAGGAADILARHLGEWLSRRFGQPIVIENRPGGGSSLAAEAVLRSRPDGYTLFMSSSANVINTLNFARDSAPVAMIAEEAIILSVNPSLPVRTLSEFIDYGKANPGKLSMASPGTGTVPHVAGELFKIMAGVDMVHVPYRGGAPALTDLVGGQVQVAFMGPTASMPFIKAGTVRALAVTSHARIAALPRVPAVDEVVAGFEGTNWFGIVAPKNTPPDIIAKLNSAINSMLTDPQQKARLEELGGTFAARSSVEFGQRLVADSEKWTTVIRTAQIKIQ